jgi:hypothetical protein
MKPRAIAAQEVCIFRRILGASLFLVSGLPLLAQRSIYVPEDHRPPLFFRETWKNPEVQERKVVQSDLTNPNLELKLYGPPTIDVRIVIHTLPKDDLVRGSGGGAGGGSRVDWIEVYGNPVAR